MTQISAYITPIRVSLDFLNITQGETNCTQAINDLYVVACNNQIPGLYIFDSQSLLEMPKLNDTFDSQNLVDQLQDIKFSNISTLKTIDHSILLLANQSVNIYQTFFNENNFQTVLKESFTFHSFNNSQFKDAYLTNNHLIIHANTQKLERQILQIVPLDTTKASNKHPIYMIDFPQITNGIIFDYIDSKDNKKSLILYTVINSYDQKDNIILQQYAFDSINDHMNFDQKTQHSNSSSNLSNGVLIENNSYLTQKSTPIMEKMFPNFCSDHIKVSDQVIAIICESQNQMLIISRKTLDILETINFDQNEEKFGQNGLEVKEFENQILIFYTSQNQNDQFINLIEILLNGNQHKILLHGHIYSGVQENSRIQLIDNNKLLLLRKNIDPNFIELEYIPICSLSQYHNGNGICSKCENDNEFSIGISSSHCLNCNRINNNEDLTAFEYQRLKYLCSTRTDNFSENLVFNQDFLKEKINMKSQARFLQASASSNTFLILILILGSIFGIIFCICLIGFIFIRKRRPPQALVINLNQIPVAAQQPIIQLQGLTDEQKEEKIIRLQKELKRHIYDESTHNVFQIQSCVICLIEFKWHDIIRETHCAHLYHEECIFQWMKFKMDDFCEQIGGPYHPLKLDCPLCNLELIQNKTVEELQEEGLLAGIEHQQAYIMEQVHEEPFEIDLDKSVDELQNGINVGRMENPEEQKQQDYDIERPLSQQEIRDHLLQQNIQYNYNDEINHNSV